MKPLKTLKSTIENVLNIEIKRGRKKSNLERLYFATYKEALFACPSKAGYELSTLVNVVYQKTCNYAQELESSCFQITSSQSFSLNILQNLAQTRSSISVIDFGGACGAHYLLARKFIDQNIKLHWHVVETPLMAKAANALSNSELKFFDTIDKAVKAFTSVDKKIDLVFSSSALQYAVEPYKSIDSLLSLEAQNIAFVRNAMTLENRDEFQIQKSFLSENGPGPLPPGFSDIELFYPVTFVQKNRILEAISKSGYRQILTFNDPSALIKNSHISFSGLFVRDSI